MTLSYVEFVFYSPFFPLQVSLSTLRSVAIAAVIYIYIYI